MATLKSLFTNTLQLLKSDVFTVYILAFYPHLVRLKAWRLTQRYDYFDTSVRTTQKCVIFVVVFVRLTLRNVTRTKLPLVLIGRTWTLIFCEKYLWKGYIRKILKGHLNIHILGWKHVVMIKYTVKIFSFLYFLLRSVIIIFCRKKNIFLCFHPLLCHKLMWDFTEKCETFSTCEFFRKRHNLTWKSHNFSSTWLLWL